MIINHILTAACNLFLLYVILQFFNDLFEIKENLKTFIPLLGLIWFVATYVTSETLHSVIVNILVSILSMLILLIPYDATLKSKLAATVMAECINSACDLLAYIVFAVCSNKDDVYSVSYIGTVVLVMVSELSLRRILRKNRCNEEIKRGIGIVVMIPIIMLVVMICQFKSSENQLYLLVTGVCTLIVSFATFYFYIIIISDQLEKVEKEALDKQIIAYNQEIKRIESTELKIEGIRHDLKHHVIEMRGLLVQGKIDELNDYISNLEKDLRSDDKLSRTGKYEIDSLINYLIEEAGDSLKNVNVKMAIPDNLDVNKYQLTIILGNLIENAIRASKESDEQSMDLMVKVDKNLLYIDIDNSFKSKPIRGDKGFLTSKKDKKGHGLGLKNVERIVREHDGNMSVDLNGNHFKVRIVMYL